MYDRASMPLAEFREHAKDAPEIAYHKSGELRNYIEEGLILIGNKTFM